MYSFKPNQTYPICLNNKKFVIYNKIVCLATEMVCRPPFWYKYIQISFLWLVVVIIITLCLQLLGVSFIFFQNYKLSILNLYVDFQIVHLNNSAYQLGSLSLLLVPFYQPSLQLESHSYQLELACCISLKGLVKYIYKGF